MRTIIAILAMTIMSCSSEVKTVDKQNIDEDLHNTFWGAVNMLEDHGTNIRKLALEPIEVIFVDDLGPEANGNSVALATKIFGDGIRIIVLEDKWTSTKYEGQQNDENIRTMLHEIGHDYFNLDHYEDGWDIMNSSDMRGHEVTQQELSNSINRMLIEGRKIYDSLSLTKRF